MYCLIQLTGGACAFTVSPNNKSQEINENLIRIKLFTEECVRANSEGTYINMGSD
jgi:hypothetical protein